MATEGLVENPGRELCETTVRLQFRACLIYFPELRSISIIIRTFTLSQSIVKQCLRALRFGDNEKLKPGVMESMRNQGATLIQEGI